MMIYNEDCRVLPDDPTLTYEELMPAIRRKFTQRLKEARKAAGLTQGELAERLGVKRERYVAWERGRNEPNVSILCTLSRELGRSPNWFFAECFSEFELVNFREQYALNNKKSPK